MGRLRFGSYPTRTHLTTAAKWLEYMLLAPALAAVARRPRDLVPAAVTLAAWDALAGIVGVLQFFGALGDLDGTPAGQRKPSFVGYHDYAALSGATLCLALLVLARGARSPAERRFAVAAGVAGGVGMVLGGAFDSLLGIVLAASAIVLATRLRDPRRLAAIAVIVLSVAFGVVAIRSAAVADGLKFLGVKKGTGGAATHIQSYRQRVLLAYIGGRIFIGIRCSASAGRARPIPTRSRRISRPPIGASTSRPKRSPRRDSAGVSRMPTCRVSPTSASSASWHSSPRCSCRPSSPRNGASATLGFSASPCRCSCSACGTATASWRASRSRR